MTKIKKTTKTKKEANDYILLDRSQSMGPKWNETLGAVNAYVKKLVEDGASGKITVATFDYVDELKFEVIRKAVDIKKWTDLSNADATPRGWTPLFDAIGKIVSMAEKDNSPKSVLIVVTDGEENQSKETTKEAAKSALDRFKDRGWQVVFLGADFDAFGQAKSVGITRDSTITATAENYGATMSSIATSRTMYASSGANMVFTDEDRAKAVAKKK